MTWRKEKGRVNLRGRDEGRELGNGEKRVCKKTTDQDGDGITG